ncbi:hypothetical protein [Ferruginibacter sp.]
MNGNKKIWLLQCILLISMSGVAQLSLPKVIGNDMVLQRNQQVPIWGYANAGDGVTVMFNGQEKKQLLTQQAIGK